MDKDTWAVMRRLSIKDLQFADKHVTQLFLVLDQEVGEALDIWCAWLALVDSLVCPWTGAFVLTRKADFT